LKTEEFIDLLASGPVVSASTATSRFALALGWAAFLATLLMAVFLGVRPDLKLAMNDAMFWVKCGMSALLMGGALIASMRLSQPGVQTGYSGLIILTPLIIIWTLAAIVLLNAEPEQRTPLILGQTWSRCPLLISGLSVPGFIAFTWAMRGLAPTRLRLAGAANGLLAGSLGATVYCLHCPELAAPFIAIWYIAGILIPTACGYLLAKRLLRW
jgi:hypothetical protein